MDSDEHSYARRRPILSVINQIYEEHLYFPKASRSECTSSYVNQLDQLSRERYNDKLTVQFPNGTLQIPDPFGGGLQYSNNPTLWPESFEYGDMYNYLINSPGPYTKDSMKSFKSLDSYSYFVNGFVQAILYSSVSADSPVCILRSRVTHSQSLTKPPVSTWIMINKSTGSVVAAHCMCMAGLGEACSHIAAVMFKLEAANRLGYTSQACTEKACSWNKDCMNGRDLDPCTLKDLSFTKPKHQSSQGRQENRSVRPLNPTSTATLGDLDLDALKRVSPEACIFSLLPKQDEDTDTASENENNVKLELQTELPTPYCHLEATEVPDRQQISEEQAELIASSTSGQGKSNLWHLYRYGRITASVLGSVVKFMNGSSKRDVSSLCSKMLGLNSFFPTRAMKWGIDHESVALASLKQCLELEGHQSVTLWNVGLYIDPDSPFLGASPDAMVSCTCCGVQCVEVKCPHNKKNAHNLDPQSFAGAKAIDCLNVTGNEQNCTISLKEKHDYFYQVLCQIGVLNKLKNVSSGLFVVWTSKGMFVQKIHHNADQWKAVKEYSELFFKQYLQPSIVKIAQKPEL
ncbi:uncharacterized protein LOC119736969 [Patiria miniata]|uniref:SWIM-type domain-containing protein n=1 Tax=Patiria miniata TaxID=46514 RepID=A0A914ATE6_PATMI|nr:uncharacterized protein LOC119736969 [Patiria miniata]